MDLPDFLSGLASRRRTFEARARFLHCVRQFFRRRGFLEVDAPLLVPSAGMEPHLDPFEVTGWATGARAFLPTSPEFYLKKLVASGVERCFCLGPAFRDEEPGRGHSPEFLMLEWYRTGSDHRGLVPDCAELLKAVSGEFLKGAVLEREGARCDLAAPPETMPLSEAFRRWVGSDWRELEEPAQWRELASRHGGRPDGWETNDCFSYLMVSVVEPALKAVPRPVVLEGYPAFQAALARLDPADPRVSQRFELFVAGVELANAYTELTDAGQQRERFARFQEERRAAGKRPHPADPEFLEAVGHLPPCAGIALGADRLLALLLGEEVRRVRHGGAPGGGTR
jgi:lysyl-tRNA synthetase class 2